MKMFKCSDFTAMVGKYNKGQIKHMEHENYVLYVDVTAVSSHGLSWCLKHTRQETEGEKVIYSEKSKNKLGKTH